MSLSLFWTSQRFSAAHLHVHVLLLAVLLVFGAASFAAGEEGWSDGATLLSVSLLNFPQQHDEPASSAPTLPSHCAEHCVHLVYGHVDAALLATGEPLTLKLQPRRLAILSYLSPPPLTPPPQ